MSRFKFEPGVHGFCLLFLIDESGWHCIGSELPLVPAPCVIQRGYQFIICRDIEQCRIYLIQRNSYQCDPADVVDGSIGILEFRNALNTGAPQAWSSPFHHAGSGRIVRIILSVTGFLSASDALDRLVW
jgi:hypothetical protein